MPQAPMRSLSLTLAIAASLANVPAAFSGCLRYGDYLHLVSSSPTPGRAFGVSVAGPYVFVAAGEAGLAVFALSDLDAPAAPVGVLDTPGEARRVALSQGLAFIADREKGLRILDVTPPTAPAPRGSLLLPDEAWDVAVLDGYAYIADWLGGGLVVVDVANPGAPAIVASRATAGHAVGVTIKRELLFVAVAGDPPQSKMIVYDITNRAAPVELSRLGTAGACWDIAVAGPRAYLACGPAGLEIVDVSNPSLPVRIGSVDTPNWATAVEVSGDFAYIADGTASGVIVADVSDPAGPAIVGRQPGDEAWDVALAGDRLLVADFRNGLRVLDVSRPEWPLAEGSVNLPNLGALIAVGERRAYVTQTDPVWGVQVVDLSDHASPRLEGSLSLEGAWAIAAREPFVYVGGAYDGRLTVVDVSDPGAPLARGSVVTGAESWGLAARGDFAFVAGFGGLRVVNVADPDAPVLAASLDVNGAAASIALAGTLACVSVIGGPNGLRIVDIANPEAPILTGSLDTGAEEVFAVAARGNVAYLAYDAFLTVDVSDPANPVELARLPLPWGAVSAIAVEGRVAYAGGESGLMVIDVARSSAPALIGQASRPRYGGAAAIHGDAVVTTRWNWPDPTGGYYLDLYPRQCPRFNPAGSGPATATGGPGMRLFPNPSTGEVRFEIEAPERAAGGPVRLEIYDVRGRLVRLLHAGTPAEPSPAWDGRDAHGTAAADGIYFARFTTGDRTAVERLVLLRPAR